MTVTETQTRPDSASPLIEGEDYYLEGAAIVFTARYLLRRGYCCESGCRHCPYRDLRETNPGEFRTKEHLGSANVTQTPEQPALA